MKKNLFNTKVTGITEDSRQVKPGFVFVAINGMTVDGHDYIKDAIKNGAKIIVGTKDIKIKGAKYVKVKDSRKEFGILASRFYGDPGKKLKIIGVTGTDGKTTTSNLIYWILKTAQKNTGLVSTINAKIKDKEYDTGFHVTNPEPVMLQSLLSRMVQKGCKYAVLEVTSHGLDQERSAGIHFETAVLTNITHEHLDYHKTFKNYVAAKGKLFKEVKYAVLNSKNNSANLIKPYVNKKAKIIKYDFDNLDKKIQSAITKRFSEKYNFENASAAVAVAKIYKISNTAIAKALKTFPQLSGRLEVIKNNKGIKLFVDFAHTPNALMNVLRMLSEQKGSGKLIAVFGCAGERDIKKRVMMPEISVKIADVSIFTAEDPRSEKIQDILSVMKKAAEGFGAKENKDFYLIEERGKAIYFAINKLAKKGDTVVICGKGHEKSMAYDKIEYPWSDQKAARMALRQKELKIPWK